MPPYILAIDTAGHACSVALVDGNETKVFEETHWISRGHAATLPTLVQKAIHPIDLAEIKAVICTRGPGGFTGMRVGLAFARSFALARSIPIYGIDSFTAVRLSIGQSIPCLIDSRRGDFFYDALTCEILNLPPLLGETIGLLSKDKIAEIPGLIAGSIWRTDSQDNLNHKPTKKVGWIEPDPVALAVHGLTLLSSKQIAHPQDITPLYVRAPSLG